MKRLFAASRFTATTHYTAEDKAKFARHFVRFVLGDFKRTLFPKWFYEQLTCTFSHIAHSDQGGFFATFFTTGEGRRRFIEITRSHTPVGDPHYCWCDVEREIQSWLESNVAGVERVLREQEEESAKAAAKESHRRASLADKNSQTFIVAAKSRKIGPFGHHQYIMVAEDGSAFNVGRTLTMPWTVGEKIGVRLAGGSPRWAGVFVECPIRLPDAPQQVVDDLFRQAT
jgi:hypothetical protein